MTNYLFISTRYRQNSRLALITLVLAFVVIILGAYTRLTDAGLSCPDWPNCFGYITAPHTETQLMTAAAKFPLTPVNVKKAWTEMGHRYAAGGEGILILILSLSILLNRKAKDWKSTFIGLALIALLCIQVMLGMLTVTEKLRPVIVLAHLLVGLSILATLWWAYLDLHLHDDFPSHLFRKDSNIPISPWFWLALIIVVLQITLGGWVSTHYAGLACVDLPYCNGKLIPNMQWNNLNGDLITIHMLHRIGAVVTAGYLAVLAIIFFTYPAFRTIAMLILALVSLQVILGILNVVWLRPVSIALFHDAIAIILLLTIITALVKASIMDNQYVFWTS